MAIAHLEGRRIRIQGTVQGVGFRPWVYRTAQSHGITGCVRNDSVGVTIEAFGGSEALSRFLNALEFPPPAARIFSLEVVDLEADPPDVFEIAASQRGTADPQVSIPPDLATCPDCVADVFDP